MSTSASLTSPAVPATRRRGKRRPGRQLAGLGFVTPFLIFYALFLVLPLVLALVMSLFNTSLVVPGFGSFAGLKNYSQLFSDSFFWQAMWHTVLFTLVSTPVLVGDVALDDRLREALGQLERPETVIVGLRPEYLVDAAVTDRAGSAGGSGNGSITFTGEVNVLESMGAEYYAYFDLPGPWPAIARRPGRSRWRSRPTIPGADGSPCASPALRRSHGR